MERDWARKGAVAEPCLFCVNRKYKIKQNLNMEKYRHKNHIKLLENHRTCTEIMVKTK